MPGSEGLRHCDRAWAWKDLGYRVVNRDGKRVWEWVCRCGAVLGELPYNPPKDVPAA